MELVRAYKPSCGYGRILDVGCGDGLLFDKLSQLGEVEGVESDGDIVRRENPYRERIHLVPFGATFEPRQRYGLILMLDVLEHLPDPDSALAHANHLLSDRGLLIVTVPAFQVLWTNHDAINHHLCRYRRSKLHQIVVDAGFDALEERYWFQWLFPVKLALRLLESATHAGTSLPSVPPVFWNQALYALCRLEAATISKLPISFGTSIAMVARKLL